VLEPVTGESWSAVNSRIVSVCLLFATNNISSSQQFVFIISVHRLTHRTAAEVKV